MKSYHWKKAAAVMAFLLLTVWVGAVFAQDPPTGPPPLPPPPAQWVAHGDYLYVPDMRSIHQYSLSDMRLKQTVILPAPQTVTATISDVSRPPLPPPMVSLLAEGDQLYVLDFRAIHKYSLPRLEFVLTVTLPEPEEAIE
jgi:hypothetical protein